MRAFTQFAAAAAMTFTMAGAANAVELVSIATSGVPGSNQIVWDGTAPGQGTMTVTNLTTILNFDDALFNDGLFGTEAKLNLFASTNGGGTLDLSLPNFTQTGLDGSFEFRRSSDNVLLLGGTFTGFWITGITSGPQANSGNFTSPQPGSVQLYSDVADLSGINWFNAGFAFSNATPQYSVDGGQLSDFSASSLAGTFGGAVPEPGTWALMIMGFGGAGAMLRSRRRTLALTA